MTINHSPTSDDATKINCRRRVLTARENRRSWCKVTVTSLTTEKVAPDTSARAKALTTYFEQRFPAQKYGSHDKNRCACVRGGGIAT